MITCPVNPALDLCLPDLVMSRLASESYSAMPGFTACRVRVVASLAIVESDSQI